MKICNININKKIRKWRRGELIMEFLKPDKTVTTSNGLKINQKIIPDSLRATKDVSSYVRKGEKMKPVAKLNGGTGKPKGITVHNTDMISVADGTNAAEQYTRATYNGNMKGVVVHYYVRGTDIWQNLSDNERGWHAADGSSRRKSQRGGSDTIGGNLDTIAIECIETETDKASEDTTAKLVAYLLDKYDLSPDTDVYQHNYFYPEKNCPATLRKNWSGFKSSVVKYYNELHKTVPKRFESDEYLKSGDNSLAVYAVKCMLDALKEKGVITQGIDDNDEFGDGTKKAVKQAQKAANITADGFVGPVTIRELVKLLTK